LGLNGFEEAKLDLEKYVRKHKDYKPDTNTLDESTKKKIYKEWEFAFKEFGYAE